MLCNRSETNSSAQSSLDSGLEGDCYGRNQSSIPCHYPPRDSSSSSGQSVDISDSGSSTTGDAGRSSQDSICYNLDEGAPIDPITACIFNSKKPSSTTFTKLNEQTIKVDVTRYLAENPRRMQLVQKMFEEPEDERVEMCQDDLVEISEEYWDSDKTI